MLLFRVKGSHLWEADLIFSKLREMLNNNKTFLWWVWMSEGINKKKKKIFWIFLLEISFKLMINKYYKNITNQQKMK
jgi:hypothetical protein